MIMDCEKYVGKCVCGRDHELETKKVVVEYGAINNFEQYMADVGLARQKARRYLRYGHLQAHRGQA